MFLSVVVPATGSELGKASRRIFGDKALRHLLGLLKEKVDKQFTPTLEDLEPFNVFAWLVPDDAKDLVNSVTKEVLKSACVPRQGAGSSEDAKAAASSTNRGRGTKTQTSSSSAALPSASLFD